MATRFWTNLVPMFDADGTSPAIGGSLTFYTTGTSDLEAIYLDADMNDEAENPLDLDADGRLSTDVFLDDTVTYRVVLKDADGNVIDEDDPVAGSDLVSGIAEHNADVNAHVTATTTNRGMVSELANDAEAVAKADTSRVLTPSNLAALDASKTFKGFVEQATDAETEAGTDDARFTSPLNLQALRATGAEILSATAGDKHFMGPEQFASNFSGDATSANWKFPGGYKILVGQFESNTDSDQMVTFAEAFASYCSIVIVQESNPDEGGAVVSWTTTGFTYNRDDNIDSPNPTLYYLALGK